MRAWRERTSAHRFSPMSAASPGKSSLLRRPVEAAVSEIGKTMRQCADELRQAAKLLDDERAVRVFDELALRHDDLAEAVAAISRSFGDLPRAPDIEHETLDAIVRAAKTVVSRDQLGLLVDERIADERELLAQIDAALALDLDEALRRQLGDARAAAEDAVQRLYAVAPR